ncbi:hypothetical protein [Priestia megaterium]|uniref:hypothetical protein n=1 Tax=Priestia megaterium TaxID=1404 RepID=UPI0021D6489F|nr:hypothetical protein [Priestia megaterium]MCU7741524.1 hypothetical protein [Priestia megaterium]
MSKRANDILAVLPVLLAIFALLLGDNLIERFTSPKLVLTTTNVSPVVPKELTNDMKNNKIPHSIKTINIKNKGSKPSKNINIKITFNGRVDNFLIDSDEIVKSKNLENGNIVSISLDRLSKNASLNVIAWSPNQNNNFDAMYTDDIENGSIEKDKEQKNIVSTYYLIWIMILLVSIGYVIYRFINNLNRKLAEDREEYNKCTAILTKMLEENDDNSDDDTKEHKDADNETDMNKNKERLLKLMNEKKEKS